MSDTQLIQETETTTTTTDPIYTHIIDRGDDPRPVSALILDAMVNGIHLTALCGYKWIPSRDPMKYPLCEKCAEIFEYALDFRRK